jgi:hypothetical protein
MSKMNTQQRVRDPVADNGTDCHSVGYGRPPMYRRFKPGQSGNPKGRPKQSRSLRSIVKDVCEQPMEIREGGRLRRMTRFEVLLRTLLSGALKGDAKALAGLMILLRQSGYLAEQDQASSNDPLQASQYDSIVEDFLKAQKAELGTADAQQPGEPSPGPTAAKDGG